jgi:hypothetical protein
MMVMMMVVMMPVAPVVMVVVMMVMVVVMGLCELHSGLRRGSWRALIDHLQRCSRIRDRLQQFGIGIGL